MNDKKTVNTATTLSKTIGEQYYVCRKCGKIVVVDDISIKATGQNEMFGDLVVTGNNIASSMFALCPKCEDGVCINIAEQVANAASTLIHQGYVNVANSPNGVVQKCKPNFYDAGMNIKFGIPLEIIHRIDNRAFTEIYNFILQGLEDVVYCHSTTECSMSLSSPYILRSFEPCKIDPFFNLAKQYDETSLINESKYIDHETIYTICNEIFLNYDYMFPKKPTEIKTIENFNNIEIIPSLSFTIDLGFMYVYEDEVDNNDTHMKGKRIFERLAQFIPDLYQYLN